MEFKFSMMKLTGILNDGENLSPSSIASLEGPASASQEKGRSGIISIGSSLKRKESYRAKIFDEESPVCRVGSPRSECYDPHSLKRAFHPLGIFSKLFGLFPCYDFNFVETLSDSRRRLIHILDYCYSAFIFSLLVGGAVLCHILEPDTLSLKDDGRFKKEGEKMDYYVKLTLIYATIFFGVQSLFIFPMKWNDVLNFIKLFTNVDKILRFDGRMEERWFAKKVIFYLVGCLIFTFSSFTILFMCSGSSQVSTQVADFLMSPVMTLALMALIIPSGLAVFFLNAVRLRLEHFNRKIAIILGPTIPSCGACMGFQDYGKELDKLTLEKKPEQLADELEKMRILHCEIRTLGNCMNCIFGFHLVRDFLYSLVALVLYTYFLIYFQEEGEFIWIVYGGQCIFIIMKILVIVCFAQLICCQNMVLQGCLQRVSLRRLPDSCATQIQAFLSAVETPPTISAAGFFNVNKALMTSILASITTYFIILIQFKLSSTMFTGRDNSTSRTTYADSLPLLQ